MPSVRIEFLPWLSERLNAPVGTHLSFDLEVSDDETVRHCLARLVAARPDLAALLPGGDPDVVPDEVTVALNGRLLDLVPGRLDATLSEGDRLTFLASFAGG